MKKLIICLAFGSIILCGANAIFGQTAYQENTTGAWDFFVSNSGTIGKDSLNNGGGWPRGSVDSTSYISGSGIWFGCIRSSEPATVLAEYSFYPKKGSNFSSLMVGDSIEPVYSSLDYNSDGTSKQQGAQPWCIRNTTGTAILQQGNTGTYVEDYGSRSGYSPVFVSDQDVVAAFTDTNNSASDAQDYPIGLIGTLTTYAWNNDSLKNCVLVKCTLQNISSDTLQSCYFAPAFAFALGDSNLNNASEFSDSSLHEICNVWCDSTPTPTGVMGTAYIQTPKGTAMPGVDLWAVYLDYTSPTPEDFYSAMKSPYTSNPPISTKVRGAISCGPFTMLPGSQTQFVYALAAGIDGAAPWGSDSTSDARMKASLYSVRNLWYGIVGTSAVEEEHNEPVSAQITNYPNPFSETTTIQLTSTASSPNISIYDMMGRRLNQNLLTRIGLNSYMLDGRLLPEGVYLLKYADAANVLTKEMIVVH